MAVGPPPISGGTLLITRDDTTAVAADPDRDAVWLIDLASQSVRARVRLPAGSEPGRAVEDVDGTIHVLLRRGGQVVLIDPQTGTIQDSRPVCPAPRGLAYDATTGNLHVACAGGELLTMDARMGFGLRTLYLDRDLRDVAVSEDNLLVSRFRSAEVLEIDGNGAVLSRVRPRSSVGDTGITNAGKPIVMSPTTAWRMVSLASGQVVMLHQRAVEGVTDSHNYGNGGNCPHSGIVSASVTTLRSGHGHIASLELGEGGILEAAPLVVDLAATRDGTKLAWIGAAADSDVVQVGEFDQAYFSLRDSCQYTAPDPGKHPVKGSLIAGAYDGKGQLWLQARNPAGLALYHSAKFIPFPDAEDVSDEGHRLFHQPTSVNIACASCHPEAGDDSHVWGFEGTGDRRSQSLRGGLLATAPFHWDGQMADMKTLLHDVFSDKMQGGPVTTAQITAISQWLNGRPMLPKSPPRDPQASARGKALFADAAVGCATCHSGTHFTNNQTVDVGTGLALQVPSLNEVGLHPPYLHNGCAATLRDRFDPKCGGGENHGHTAHLTATQLDDLVAYLDTL